MLCGCTSLESLRFSFELLYLLETSLGIQDSQCKGPTETYIRQQTSKLVAKNVDRVAEDDVAVVDVCISVTENNSF